MNVTTPLPPDRSRHSQRGTVLVNVFGKTDVGRTREHNEDSFVVADLSSGNATLQPEVRQHVAGPRGSLFMVADGMRSEEHTSELSHRTISYAVFCLKKKNYSRTIFGKNRYARR